VSQGRRFEVQLKGAGTTPFSRHADGRAVLRSSVREYVASEAMAALGVATTRALSVVASGDDVWRDEFYDGRPSREPAAVVCRVAPSFLRVGSLELHFANRNRGLLRALADHIVAQWYPQLVPVGGADAADAAAVYAALLREVSQRTAAMVAQWHVLGFVHGAAVSITLRACTCAWR
jgi:uncharacterized protein YdiU (UPF0061 family)